MLIIILQRTVSSRWQSSALVSPSKTLNQNAAPYGDHIEPVGESRADVEMGNEEDEEPSEAQTPRVRMNPKNPTSREEQEHEDSGHAVHRSWCALIVSKVAVFFQWLTRQFQHSRHVDIRVVRLSKAIERVSCAHCQRDPQSCTMCLKCAPSCRKWRPTPLQFEMVFPSGILSVGLQSPMVDSALASRYTSYRATCPHSWTLEPSNLEQALAPMYVQSSQNCPHSTTEG